VADGDIQNMNPIGPQGSQDSSPMVARTKVKRPSGPVYRQQAMDRKGKPALNVNLYGVKPQVLSKYINTAARTDPIYKSKMVGVLSKVAASVEEESKTRSVMLNKQDQILSITKVMAESTKMSASHSSAVASSIQQMTKEASERERRELLKERSKQKFVPREASGIKTNELLQKIMEGEYGADGKSKK